MESANQSNYLAEILLSTTWECNLNCAYCFVEKSNLETCNTRMSPELATRVIDALDAGMTHVETICIHFYGGEPLMNLPAMESMVKRAREKLPGRFRFAITTNGTNSSKEAFEILEAGKFEIILSIDGPEYIHDECRRTIHGKPTHASVMRFLEGVRSNTNCWVRGSSVVRSGWSLMEANAYLHTLPVDAIKAQAVRLPPETPYALSEQQRQAYMDDLEKIGKQVIAELEAERVPRDDRFSARVLQLLKGVTREYFCGAGHTIFGITPDGTIFPCILVSNCEAKLGHIDDPPETWLSQGEQWRKNHHSKAECKDCTALPLCGGGCHAIKPVCGEDECDIIRKNCEVARSIYNHFKSNPVALLGLAGIV